MSFAEKSSEADSSINELSSISGVYANRTLRNSFSLFSNKDKGAYDSDNYDYTLHQ